MKARVPKSNNKSLSQMLNSGIVLSIGMIVKNEHKHIRKCLEALQPLRDAISCELIIADTGSTDDTFEICKEFTDNVYHFEWIDDFAAARNSTLTKAKGMWYMFIDADEYLDKDISAMIEFFTDSTNKHICATYIIRNYSYKNSIVTSFPAPRIARNLPSLKFVGRIHESLDVPNEFYNLPTLIHHYGYFYETEEQKKAKDKRNVDLMLKELKKNPDDVRLLVHIGDSTQGEEQKKYVEKAIDILRKEDYSKMDLKKGIYTQNQMYRGRAYISVCVIYSADSKDFETSYNYAKEYFSEKAYENSYATIDMYVILAEACKSTKRYTECLAAYSKYFECYDKMLTNKLDTFDTPVLSLFNADKGAYLANKCHYITVLAQTGEYEQAHSQLESIDINDISYSSYEEFCVGFNTILNQSKYFDRIVNLYHNVAKTNDNYKIETFTDNIESYYRKNPQDRVKFIDTLAQTNAIDIPFVRLMQLLQKDKNGENITKDLQNYFDNTEKIATGQTEAIYLALKYKVYLPKLLKTASHARVQLIFTDIVAIHGAEYIDLVMEYCDYEQFANNINELFWAVTMLYFAVKRCENLPLPQKSEIYDKFCNYLAAFVENLYNPEVLNAEDVQVLPPLYRFGFYIGKAKLALENNDKLNYIRALKDGLSLCEEMKDVVAFLISPAAVAI
ncbi:MAG: glycosyltransferase family 2 protein [Oscillospiraceae bacterium]|jgi:glycosyltransferase involved in cell wall biosynthesis|nr:glycosyltransferase family 2 protein [Oscillospiraceae bacterium]